jgi:dTDP-4-amino-4,6-dideoxygalactose transaminase
MIDKYTWVDKGSSYLMSDVNAAILTAQLEHAEIIQQRRHQAFLIYMEGLCDWANKVGARLPHHLAGEDRPAHLFPILMPDLNRRTRLIEHARAQEVFLTFHYVPLHHSPGGERFGRYIDDFSNTQNISDTLVRLPLFSDMTDDNAARVIETLIDSDL